jgi:tRNA nucleotidyltransferase/poly(A) polymerase
MIQTPVEILDALCQICTTRAISAWLVGGTVRDLVMGNHPFDLDIAVDTDGVALARELANITDGSFVLLDKERGTGRVVYTLVAPSSPLEKVGVPSYPDKLALSNSGQLIIDIVQLRAATIEDDLSLRDFTINAMALNLHEAIRYVTSDDCHLSDSSIIDPCGGLHDSATKTLRLCCPTSIQDDPVRLLRAVRLAANLSLDISPDLDITLKQEAYRIDTVAIERVREELMKLLVYPYATPWLFYLDECRILTRIFPELEPTRNCEQPIFHFLPVLGHLLETVASIEWLLAGLTNGQRSTHFPPSGNRFAQPAAVERHPELPCTLPYAERLREHFFDPMRSGYPRSAMLKFATLLHDNAKPQTKQPKPEGGVTFYGHQKIGAKIAFQIAQRLHFSRRDARYVESVVRHHMRPGHLQTSAHATSRALVRFLRDTSEGELAATPDILLHNLADYMAATGPAIDTVAWHTNIAWMGMMLDRYWETFLQQTKPLINGNDILTTFHLKPGKVVGKLLKEVDEAQAAGEIHSREEALSLARHVLEHLSGTNQIIPCSGE